MNIIEIFSSFQTQEQAVDYLERVRWEGQPICPYCLSKAVGVHASGDRSHSRWQCRTCFRAFSVTVGTLFHGTHKPLKQWFLVLALMFNNKDALSSRQISTYLGIRQPTVWSMMKRIRTVMAADLEQESLLRRIVGAEENYSSGTPSGKDKQTTSQLTSSRDSPKKVVVFDFNQRSDAVSGQHNCPGASSVEGTFNFSERLEEHYRGMLLLDQSHTPKQPDGKINFVKKFCFRFCHVRLNIRRLSQLVVELCFVLVVLVCGAEMRPMRSLK